MQIDPRPDFAEIQRAAALFLEPGGVTELRVPKTQRDGTISGYFSDPLKLSNSAAALNGKGPGIYSTLNPVRTDALARADNRVKLRASSTTTDSDILRRNWLLLDFDPVRAAGISSTDTEHSAALQTAREVRNEFRAAGWPEPVFADSGNGAHLLYRLDLLNDVPATELIKAVLNATAKRYSDASVAVDRSVYNAARISKVYGTTSQKGDSTPERPHRVSRILELPESILAVPEELLRAVAAEVGSDRRLRVKGAQHGSIPDVEQWLLDRGMVVASGPAPHNNGLKWTLENCPFNPEHHAPDAAVFQGEDGRLGFKCFHASCADKQWNDVLKLFGWGHENAMAFAGGEGYAAHGVLIDDQDKWPRLEPLQSELPPVQSFDETLLPESFRPLVRDLSERMQVPMDYPVVSLVVCLGGVVNRRVTIQPKAHDAGWKVVPNLWGGIVAPPGSLKSPVLAAAARPLNQIQSEWWHQHEEAMKHYAQEKEEHELRCAAWKEQFKANAKAGKSSPKRPEAPQNEPKSRRLILNDATFEKLHEVMSANPAGVLVIRDELTGWWSQLDRAGREGERAFYLQAWNGDTGYSIDRMGRGTTHVEGCCVSMLGGIQPGRLRCYLADALKDGPGNDGLIQRFQLLVWPDTAAEWNYVDRSPDSNSERRVARIFNTLVDLDQNNSARFCFASDAQELFKDFLTQLESKVRGGELHPALVSHLSKYRSLMPSLALLFELADRASYDGFVGSALAQDENLVSLEHARQAAAWCGYLEQHARRVYSCIVTPQLRAAQELADKVKQRRVGVDGYFSCRDVYLKGWSGLDSPESVKQAVEVLQDAGWIRELRGASGGLGGRPSNRFEINPEVWK